MEIIALSYVAVCLIIVYLWPKSKNKRIKKSRDSNENRKNIFILVALIMIISGVGLSAFILQNGIGGRPWVAIAIDLKHVILGVGSLTARIFFETRVD